MTSAKQSRRRRAQGATPPPVRRKGARRQASPKILAAAAAMLVLVGAGIGIAVAFTGSGSSPADVAQRGSLANALPGATEVQRLLRGIPQRGRVLGRPSAPVTMVEYIDLQCPYCQQFETQIMPGIIERYVRPGKVKVETRILAFLGLDSERGRRAALAAGRQGKLFNFTHLLYANQGAENSGWLSDEMVETAAARIPGLDVPRLIEDRDNAAIQGEEKRIEAQAQADAVGGTPTVLVGKTGQKPQPVTLTSPTDPQPVQAAIENALP